MQEDSASIGALTLEISTWFQVHRDRDEYCCRLEFAGKKFGYSYAYTEYANHDGFMRKIVEFAMLLIEFPDDPVGEPKFWIAGYDPIEEIDEYHYRQIGRIRIIHSGKGLAQLEFHHFRIYNLGIVEETSIQFEIREEVVRQMGRNLLAAVVEDHVHFTFNLVPTAMISTDEAFQSRVDSDDVPF